MQYTFALYFRLIGVQVRSAMQYRASFITELFGNFVVTLLDFLAMVLLLTRFQVIGTWGLPEVALLYGTSAVSLSLAEVFGGAFEDFDRLVVRGEFDRVLIRPLGLVFQMITSALPLRRLGRLLQGLIAIIFSLALMSPHWRLGQWLFLPAMLAGGALFFLAIFVLAATMAFWTPQTAEIGNIFTYGGQFMTSYPMSIYQDWMREVFTFLIPMAFINYYPALYLLNKPDPLGLPEWVAFLAPGVAGVAFAVALAAWRRGVRRYQSSGS